MGDEVTLSCGNVTDYQDECNSTSWYLSDIKNQVMLVDRGQINNNGKSTSDRLSVTENCSLVIKKVTAEDVGIYTCRQIKSGEPQYARVHLSVVTSKYLYHVLGSNCPFRKIK